MTTAMKIVAVSTVLVCFWLTTEAGKVSKCATVKCSECRECRLNDQGAPRCVYKRGCCPSDQPTVNCFVSPCLPATTQMKCPNATECIEDYCGGCNAHYYDTHGNEICTNGPQQQAEARVKRSSPCPSGQPTVNCFVSPCLPAIAQKRCPNAAKCVEDYCGGCNAHFYDTDGNEICTAGSQQQAEARTKRHDLLCRGNTCPVGQTCVPSPKQCFTTPCPQYDCI